MTVTILVADSVGDVSATESFTIAVAAVQPSLPTVSLTDSTDLTASGSQVTLTATVSGINGVLPTGTVSFSQNGSTLGSKI